MWVEWWDTGIFLDGTLETVNWAYPKPDFVSQTGTYTIGDDSKPTDTKTNQDEGNGMSWAFGSCSMLGKPLGTFFPSLSPPN